VFDGARIHTSLRGSFNVANSLAAAALARAIGITTGVIAAGIEKVKEVPGRAQFVRLPKNQALAVRQNFDVVVDYAHTADSLEAIYGAFPSRQKVCVLGSTGGGRDKWKRKEMGKVADAHCDTIILTNEDPYDENPEEIIKGIAEGVTRNKPEIILDRREAIRRGIDLAADGGAVIITGKGTDPYIMEANGQKTPWNEAVVALEELEKSLAARHGSPSHWR
jgi:UDP-N-acetylmuramoyl-L-alanyl-D-glutamate--2,6-diaminopimelate ligase